MPPPPISTIWLSLDMVTFHSGILELQCFGQFKKNLQCVQHFHAKAVHCFIATTNSKISTFAPLKYRISFNVLCRHYTLYCLSRDSIHATGIFTFIAQSFITNASQPRSSHHWLMFSIYTTKIVECVCPPTISETVAVRTMILAQCPRIASITIKLFQNKFYYPFYTLYLKKMHPIRAGTPNIAQIHARGRAMVLLSGRSICIILFSQLIRAYCYGELNCDGLHI